MRRLSATALVVLVCLAALAAPLAAADGAYDLTSDSAVDVPDRQVEVQGDTFTISAITRADPGDTISVTVTAPSGAETTTLLYDNDQNIVDAADSTGTSTVEFDLSGFDAGTYSLVLQDDGVREAAHPVVVRGYSVTSVAPTSVGPDDTFTVTADVSKLRGDDLTRVEVVVANDATTLRADATATSGNAYEASVDASRLGTGSYQVYATVRGPEQAIGNDELLGLDDPSTLDVEEQPSGGGGGVSTTTDTATTTSDGTTTDTATTTPTGPQPDERVTTEIVDERSGEPGVTVAVETQTLSTITFADESVQLAGDVTVERGPAAAAPFDDQFGADAVLTAVDVSVPPAAVGSAATLRFTVDAAALGDRGPATVGVVREVDGGVELLPTDTERSGSTLTVTAQTPGFSRFAVVSLERLAPDAPDTTDASDASDSSSATPTADDAVTPVDSPATTSGDGDSAVFVLLGLLGTAVVLAARLSGR